MESSTSMIVEEDKSVRFEDSRGEVFYVPGRDDVTREELLASYFTEDDYLRIREREKRLASQFSEMGRVVDVDKDGLGLESKEEKQHRRQRVRNGQMSVNHILPPPRVVDDYTNGNTTTTTVLLVLSGQHNFLKRQAIRETWAANHTNVYFVIGQSNCDESADDPYNNNQHNDDYQQAENDDDNDECQR